MNKTILPITLCYVDDDKDDLDIFEQAMEPFVEKVVLFQISADFLSSMKHLPLPAIVFVDLNMPSFTGFQIIEFMRAKKRFKNLPIIILSTSIDHRTKQSCWELGADFCIVKPRQIQQLTLALNYVINIDWTVYERSFENFVYQYDTKIT